VQLALGLCLMRSPLFAPALRAHPGFLGGAGDMFSIAYARDTYASGKSFRNYLSAAAYVQANWTASASVPGVPEPASMAVFGVGLLGLGMAVRRKLA